MESIDLSSCKTFSTYHGGSERKIEIIFAKRLRIGRATLFRKLKELKN